MRAAEPLGVPQGRFDHARRGAASDTEPDDDDDVAPATPARDPIDPADQDGPDAPSTENVTHSNYRTPPRAGG